MIARFIEVSVSGLFAELARSRGSVLHDHQVRPIQVRGADAAADQIRLGLRLEHNEWNRLSGGGTFQYLPRLGRGGLPQRLVGAASAVMLPKHRDPPTRLCQGV